MTWTKENMFEPSGCLTREAFEALVNHQLPASAKALADEHGWVLLDHTIKYNP